jgi:GalNAc-alpha-(1->4)-GalNAc-alpha-(1->3)-diNAcBac-PP-undecaprenol alpha-1,4-N-acetyl-D-galactosaminyltransferase
MLLMPSISYGGAHKMIVWVANQIDKNYDVVIGVYYSIDTDYVLDDDIELKCMNIKRYSNPIISNTIGLLNTEVKIIKFILKEKPSIVMTFGDIFSSLLLPLIKRLGYELIACERNNPNIDMPYGLGSLRKKLFSYADRCAFQTEDAKNVYDINVQRKSCVIPNPVTLNFTTPPSWGDRRKEISFVGRFEIKQKRQDIMLEAFEIIFRKHPEYTLVFYGDGEDLQKVKDISKQLSSSKNIRFAGRVKDVMNAIRGSSIFVLTSDYEGIPNTLIEAMAVALPSIATDCAPGGARMLLGNNTYGLIVKRGDSNAIAESVIYLLDHPYEAEMLGLQAQKSCERFEPKKIAKMWNSFIVDGSVSC